jgi:hypothetical protein
MRSRNAVLVGVLSSMLLASSAQAYTFAPAPGSPYAPVGPVEPNSGGYLGGIATGDFNGDGISDLAVVNASGVPPLSPGESVTVFLGARSGGMVEAPGSPVSIFNGGELSEEGEAVAADFNGDGHLDLAVVDQVHQKVAVLLGDGTGRFALAAAPVTYAGRGDATLVTGDFNGDGKPDVAVVNEDVNILLGNGAGGFTPASGSPLTLSTFSSSAAAGDFNGDARSDLAVGEQSGDVRVLLAGVDGELQPAPGSPIALGSAPSGMIAADLTGRGPLDLTMTNSTDDMLSVLLGNGQGGFTPSQGSPFHVPDGNEDPGTPGLPDSVGVGDFACNGESDLAVANFNGSSDNVAVLEGNGSGVFTGAPGSLFPANGNPRPLVVGDFNGDGAPDIAVVNPFMSRVTVLYDTTSNCPHQLESRRDPSPVAHAFEPTDSILSPLSPQIEGLSCTVRTIAGRREMTLRLSLADSATVVARLERVVRRRVRGRWHERLAEVASFTLQGKAGANVLMITSSRHLHLVPGRYEMLVLAATRGGRRSQVRTATLTVHR